MVVHITWESEEARAKAQTSHDRKVERKEAKKRLKLAEEDHKQKHERFCELHEALPILIDLLPRLHADAMAAAEEEEAAQDALNKLEDERLERRLKRRVDKYQIALMVATLARPKGPPMVLGPPLI